jgi:hypothetical protein
VYLIAILYQLIPDPNLVTFNPAEGFTTSDQADPIDYKLYKLNEGFTINQAYIAIQNGESGLNLLTSNASLITTYSGSGEATTFTGLASGLYTIVAVYDNDGTQDGDDEVEQCYEILGQFNVAQRGCTNPENEAYNPEATIAFACPGDASCTPINFGVDVVCDPEEAVQIHVLPIEQTNPDIAEAVANGFAITSGPFSGHYFSPSAGNARRYAWYEKLCWPLYSNSFHLPNGFFEESLSDFHINTNGEFIIGNSGPGHMIIVNHSIVMGDGTLYNSIPETSFENLLDGQQITFAPFGGNNFCDFINTYGVPTGVQFSYNYGAPNSFQFTETSFVPFTEDQINTILACCGLEIELPEGCTDPSALNFDQSAILACGGNNSCCEYPPPPPEVPGCTDPAASNYNPEATVDDGSCEYPVSSGGSWAQNTCFACDYFPNNPNFYSTEAECLENIDPDNDCCELNNFDDIAEGSVSMSGAGSSSTFNAETNLCDDDSTGQLTVSLPGNQLQNLIDNLQNPDTVMYNWRIINYTQNLYWDIASGNEGENIPLDGILPDLNNGEQQEVLPITGLDINPFTTIAELNNIPHGLYAFTLNIYHQGYYDDEGNPKIPDLTPYGPDVVCAQGFVETLIIPLDNCDDGSGNTNITDCTDPEATNYNPLANIDCGCCEYEEVEPPNGCMCQDGTFDPSCCPPDPICGCMDPNAINYNPAATFQDDSSCPCEYEFVGCIEDCDSVTTTIPACIPPNIDRSS